MRALSKVNSPNLEPWLYQSSPHGVWGPSNSGHIEEGVICAVTSDASTEAADGG